MCKFTRKGGMIMMFVVSLYVVLEVLDIDQSESPASGT